MEVSEISRQIIDKLSVQDVLAFESTSKNFRLSTASYWTECSKNFPTWGECSQLPDRDKWNVCLNMAIDCFFHVIVLKGYPKPDLRAAQKIKKQFKGLIEKFPGAGFFFETEMYEYASTKPPSITNLNARMAKVIDGALLGWPGELLLQTVLEVKDPFAPSEIVDQYAMQAIEKGATRVSLYLLYHLESHKNEKIDLGGLGCRTAFESAKRGDLSALDRFVEFMSYERILANFNAVERYPPLLVEVARISVKNQKFEQAEELIKEAVEKYKGRASPGVLAKIGGIYYKLNQREEAERFFNEAINAYSKDLHYEIFETNLERNFQDGWLDVAEIIIKKIFYKFNMELSLDEVMSEIRELTARDNIYGVLRKIRSHLNPVL